MSATPVLRIGVYVPQEVQLLDISPVDLFGMISPKYLSDCRMPEALVDQGVHSNIHYISLPRNGTHVELTAGFCLKMTNMITDAEVQPGELDIILVPGPNPNAIFDEETMGFLIAHAAWKGENGKKVDILSVCSGCCLLAQSGILKGRSASGPRPLVSSLAKQFPDTTWDDSVRWVHDKEIWSSGE